MARLLLVSGACHGAWCWDGLRPGLAALGHEAPPFDLPAHGDDTPPEAATLEGYADAIDAALTPGTVIVAHSMAGVPATLAADRRSGKVAGVIYLCAYVPKDGDSIASLIRAQAHQPLRPALRRAAGGQAFGFAPELATDLFYHDCPAGSAAAAIARHCPEPTAPQSTAARLSGAIAAVPRSYILCNRDRAIPPDDQRRMAEGLNLYETEWGHSPFLSHPDGLVRMLDSIVRG